MSAIKAFLSPKLRAFQIYGANTEVGKTIFSTALCRQAAKRLDSKSNSGVNYIKPVSTGEFQDADIK